MQKKIKFIYFHIKNVFHVVLVSIFVFFLIIFPKTSFDAASSGVNLWFNIVLPSLLPFFIGSELLIRLGFVNFLGTILEPVTRKIFNVSGSGAFAIVMGFTSGYPSGAKIVSDLSNKKLCTKIECERLLAFTNNSGPLFILGAIAIGMFQNPKLGVILALSHYSAAITLGILFRFYKRNKNSEKSLNITHEKVTIKRALKEMKKFREHENDSFGALIGESIIKSMNLLLIIVGFIVFFSVLIALLNQLKIISMLSILVSYLLKPLNIDRDLISACISGFFELTSGAKMIAATNATIIQKSVATSLILGWAGICIHLQVISIISKTNINPKPYLCAKFAHGIISSIYTYAIMSIPLINLSTHVFKYDINSNYIYINNLAFSIQSLFINIFLLLFLSIISIFLITLKKEANT